MHLFVALNTDMPRSGFVIDVDIAWINPLDYVIFGGHLAKVTMAKNRTNVFLCVYSF